MSGWKGILWAAVCGTGILLFLKAVADELDRVERDLRGLEQAQRRAFERKKAMSVLAADG